jgi:hypothetical protein
MKRSLPLLLCFVALFSNAPLVAMDEVSVVSAPAVTALPVQAPVSTPALPDFFSPVPTTPQPWQPMAAGCTLAFCNRCTQADGICQFTGGHCVCI